MHSDTSAKAFMSVSSPFPFSSHSPSLSHLSSSSFFFISVFQLCHTTYRILVPRAGIEPVPPSWEAQSLHCWTTREVPISLLQLAHFSTCRWYWSCCPWFGWLSSLTFLFLLSNLAYPLQSRTILPFSPSS